jgi:hypothetical protein
MHRLKGWRIPPVPVYRYADGAKDAYSTGWSLLATFMFAVTVEKGRGIVEMLSRDRYNPPYLDKLDRVKRLW